MNLEAMALRVITARINGEFDNPEALAWCEMYGPWSTSTLDDVACIAALSLQGGATVDRVRYALNAVK